MFLQETSLACRNLPKLPEHEMSDHPLPCPAPLTLLHSHVMALQARGLSVVTTNGTFDLFHAGHLDTLEGARALGDFLIVLVNSDDSVQRLKGPQRPYLPVAERCRLLAALRCVDAVAVFEQDTPLELLAALRPQVHVKGGSFVPERVAAERMLLASWGGRLELVPLREGRSSTALVEQIWRDHPTLRLETSIP